MAFDLTACRFVIYINHIEFDIIRIRIIALNGSKARKAMWQLNLPKIDSAAGSGHRDRL